MSGANDRLRQNWDRAASGWEKWDDFMMAFLQPVGEALIDRALIKSGYRVLDLACGTGEPGLSIARRYPGAEVVGADLSAAMTDVANRNAAAKGLANYSAVVASAEELPFGTGEFDAAVCRFGAMLFADPRRALAELGCVIKPPGRLAFAVWAGRGQNLWATTAFDVVGQELKLPAKEPDEPHMFRFADVGELAEMVEAAGFAKPEIDLLEGRVIYESPNQYWQLMSEVSTVLSEPLKELTPEQLREIRAEVEAATEPFTQDGQIVFNWAAWLLLAEKL